MKNTYIQRILFLICGLFLVYLIILFKTNTREEIYIQIESKHKIVYPEEEINFPLAFAIVVHTDPLQVMRLFKAIYRPHNVYCFHVDTKSGPGMQVMVNRIAEKYKENVVLPKRPISVAHASFSVLEAELICMQTLMTKTRVRWRYYINLTGQEWPLKTNLELVRILQTLNGSNLIEKAKPLVDRIPKKPLPHNLNLWQGAVHIIAKREFVKFVLTNNKTNDYKRFLNESNARIPDESFFSTINSAHSLRAPGGYSGNLERDPKKFPYLNRHKIWQFHGKCNGIWIRYICIFGQGDIKVLTEPSNKMLFANKFIVGINDQVLDYMESWFDNRTKVVYSNIHENPFIDLSFYARLPQVKHHF